jgi:hypothetical protein
MAWDPPNSTGSARTFPMWNRSRRLTSTEAVSAASGTFFDSDSLSGMLLKMPHASSTESPFTFFNKFVRNFGTAVGEAVKRILRSEVDHLLARPAEWLGIKQRGGKQGEKEETDHAWYLEVGWMECRFTDGHYSNLHTAWLTLKRKCVFAASVRHRPSGNPNDDIRRVFARLAKFQSDGGAVCAYPRSATCPSAWR